VFANPCHARIRQVAFQAAGAQLKHQSASDGKRKCTLFPKTTKLRFHIPN